MGCSVVESLLLVELKWDGRNFRGACDGWLQLLRRLLAAYTAVPEAMRTGSHRRTKYSVYCQYYLLAESTMLFLCTRGVALFTYKDPDLSNPWSPNTSCSIQAEANPTITCDNSKQP